MLIDVDDTTKEERIIGYIALRATSITIEADKDDFTYTKGHPALEISELAIDEKYERSGYGTSLVGYAIVKAAELRNEHIGIEYIAVCADLSAIDFYAKAPLDFVNMDEFYDVPRDGWNVACTPMLRKL